MDSRHWINSLPINGCTAFNSSRAFMRTGIPSENLSIRSFMALPTSDCAAAATVAVMTGVNGATLFCVVATSSPRAQDQRIIEKNEGTEDTPTVSNSRLMLANFGSSLTASHASASLSGTGSLAGIISGEGSEATLVGSTPGMAGTGGDNPSTPLSVVGPLSLDVKGDVGVSWEGSVDGGLFAFQGRRMVAINSLACRPRWGMLGS